MRGLADAGHVLAVQRGQGLAHQLLEQLVLLGRVGHIAEIEGIHPVSGQHAAEHGQLVLAAVHGAHLARDGQVGLIDETGLLEQADILDAVHDGITVQQGGQLVHHMGTGRQSGQAEHQQEQ